jgi:hypothetical protein
MASRHKCTYTGIRLLSGKLYVIADWGGWAMPRPLKNPGRYSKIWNWGEQSGKQAYDLAYAMILHAFRTIPGKEIVANRYAIPYAEGVLHSLPTYKEPVQAYASTHLWSIPEDDVLKWVTDYEQSLRDNEAQREELAAMVEQRKTLG